ncbi:hypothetical protein [Nocardia sienata]|uniref:hypothetical protein n=1 Tax=Nocardia sienata TaxID=248552 RepID=UPI0007A3BDC8|nr:hypothetical protein [Nocardia sienata]
MFTGVFVVRGVEGRVVRTQPPVGLAGYDASATGPQYLEFVRVRCAKIAPDSVSGDSRMFRKFSCENRSVSSWDRLWQNVIERAVPPIQDLAAVFKTEYGKTSHTLRGGAGVMEDAAQRSERSITGLGNDSPAASNLRVLSSTPHYDLNTLLSRYAYTDDNGWTGADSTYVRRLPDGRHVFMFSDTFLGRVDEFGARSRDTPFVSNSFVLVERDGSMRTVLGSAPDGGVRAVFPPRGEQFHWLGGSHVTSRNTLDTMFLGFTGDSRVVDRGGDFDAERLRMALIPGGQGELDFQENLLVRFDAHDLRQLDVTAMPSESGVHWASWVEFDQHTNKTYVYGVDDRGPRNSCTSQG